MKKQVMAIICAIGLAAASCCSSVPTHAAEKAAGPALSNPRMNMLNGVSTWDCVYFGNYWQNDTNGDGTADKKDKKEPVKWRVLSVDGDDAFLLADCNLDCRPYDLKADGNTTWETCTLRSWLNGYGSNSNHCGEDYSLDNFIDAAFDQTEQSAIRVSKVANSIDKEYYGVSQDNGRDTEDRVYLLSIDEARTQSYGFSPVSNSIGDTTRSAPSTAYAERLAAESKDYVINGNPDFDYPALYWWLRSSGSPQTDSKNESYIYPGAISGSSGAYAFNYGGSSQKCRPALHLDLSAAANLYSYAGTVSSNGESTGGEPTGFPAEDPEETPPQNTPADPGETETPSQTPTLPVNGDGDYVKADGTPDQGMISQNIHKENYGNWASVVKSHLYLEKNGSISRVESIGGKILVENYNPKTFSLLSQKTLDMELPLFGGFYAGEQYNYLVFGQNNLEEDDRVEVCRIVQYDKDWNRIKSDGLLGANTYKPFDGGSLRMCEYGDYLYVQTCHEMYASEDGFHHQSSLSVSFCQTTGKITDSFSGVMNIGMGYVSHSFNQFTKTDGTDLLAVHHGDAYPRSIVLVKYGTPAGQQTFTGMCSNVNILNISGMIGSNYTGVNVGGFETSADSYLVAYRSIDQKKSGASKTYNVYVGSVKKTSGSLSGSQADTIQITSFADGGEYSAANPFLVKVSESRFLLLWEVYKGSSLTGNIQYVMLDSTGHMTGEIKDCAGALSDCQPVLKNGEAVWYVTDKSTPVFYTINLSDMQLRTINGNQSTTPVTYSIIKETTGLRNATVMFSKEKGISGTDAVTLNIIPDEGYSFKDDPTVTVVGASAGPAAKNQDGTYTCSITDFTKDAAVTVKGSAAKDTPADVSVGEKEPDGVKDPGTGQNPDNAKDPGTGQNPDNAKDPGTGQNPNNAKDPGTGQNPDDAKDPGTGQDLDNVKDPDAGQTAASAAKKPKKAVIRSIKNAKGKKVVITLKSSSNIAGYQIRYSTKTNMKGAKSKTSKTNKIILKGLKKKRTYYIQARAYRKVSGGKRYGKWSIKAAVKIQK